MDRVGSNSCAAMGCFFAVLFFQAGLFSWYNKGVESLELDRDKASAGWSSTTLPRQCRVLDALKTPGQVDTERARLLVPQGEPTIPTIYLDKPPVCVVPEERHTCTLPVILFHNEPSPSHARPSQLKREEEHVMDAEPFILFCHGNVVEPPKQFAVRDCCDNCNVRLSLTIWKRHSSANSSTVLSETTHAFALPSTACVCIHILSLQSQGSNRAQTVRASRLSMRSPNHFKPLFLFFSLPFALVWDSTRQTPRPAHAPPAQCRTTWSEFPARLENN